MSTQLLTAIIGAGAVIVAAIIGAVAVLSGRAKSIPSATLESHNAQAEGVTFVDIGLADVTPREWIEETQPKISPRERSARWYFRRPMQVGGSDLPLESTVINGGRNPVVISRVGIEIVAGMNAWYSGSYYGIAPEAAKIELAGAYELRLPESKGIQQFVDLDPDEVTWYEIGETYGVALADPMYLENGVPFRFTLTVKQYDIGMPTHTIIRLWLRTSAGEIRSDGISIIFPR